VNPMLPRMPDAAGVVLAGGRSSRMGAAKAGLEWHGSTLVYRAAAVLGRSVGGPVVVVAAPGQELPALPAGVGVVRDPEAGLGPLQGLAAGLASVADRADAAFVCSTDLPFLHPAFVRRVLDGLDDGVEVVLPVARGFRQPLAAAYRTSLVGLVGTLLGEGNRKLGLLFDHCGVTRLDEARLLADPVLARHDPALESVLNINTPEEYAAARSRPAPEIVVEGHPPRTIRAATVAAASVALESRVVSVNGEAVRDEQLPLVGGDTVATGG
jgi:molybdopterin-guanine dinucleotide biosynthesis protein A